MKKNTKYTGKWKWKIFNYFGQEKWKRMMISFFSIVSLSLCVCSLFGVEDHICLTIFFLVHIFHCGSWFFISFLGLFWFDSLMVLYSSFFGCCKYSFFFYIWKIEIIFLYLQNRKKREHSGKENTQCVCATFDNHFLLLLFFFVFSKLSFHFCNISREWWWIGRHCVDSVCSGWFGSLGSLGWLVLVWWPIPIANCVSLKEKINWMVCSMWLVVDKKRKETKAKK